ncbi:signal transduction histidine kinase [Variovorax boronicumulans]|uniref:sensor histidine kinase n=1 Tax=Variovorax boronicumulans TaxID=436515 RepID=UPI0024763EEC|nr:HAMP domain-containing sensor histidine kinase [Variovorax boronicumulans]MDH6167131.1 signal transduction histidine kinase [Variovorax boronicumulans]
MQLDFLMLWLGKRLRSGALRYRFTVALISVAVVVSALVFFALYDSLTSARAAEQQVRQSGLDAELSNFLYATKENALLENPGAFSAAERPLSVVTLKSSFYTYLLNRGNARSLTAEKINWEPPRACVLEFAGESEGVSPEPPPTLQACFAAVAGDTSGRYIYFSLRYPSPAIARHRPGKSLASADRVVLTLENGRDRTTVLSLVFEPPTLAASRYPSQLGRFAGIHEVSAFLASTPERATRWVNAQAFERSSEEDSRGNIVTMVGRIDPALFESQGSDEWPSTSLGQMKIGLTVISGTAIGRAAEVIKVAPGAMGTALVSLEKTYLSTVTSGARLDIARDTAAYPEKIWSSADLQLPAAPRRTSWSQKLFDYWARVSNLSGADSSSPESNKEHLSGGPFGTFSARLRAEPIMLPEVVTRAFGWLTTALVLLLVLLVVGFTAGIRLFILGRHAASLQARGTGEFERIRSPYGNRRDEISRLGRILFLYFNRLSQKNIALSRRMRHEAAAHARDVRLMEAQLELREATLDAIGHEIRSPLQTLINKVGPESDLYAPISRMLNGVEKLYLAASVEDGIGDQEVICSTEDLAAFLSSYVANTSDQISRMRYSGPTQDVMVLLDPIMFERVLSHLVDNALRYIDPDGELIISLSDLEDGVVVEVFNHGERIPEALLARLFRIGSSDRSTARNRGLGLHASRAYLLKMRATIMAENRSDGVAMVIVFPRFEPEPQRLEQSAIGP